MKFNALISTLFAVGAMASACHPSYPCCNNCDVYYTDYEGEWGVQNNDWCFINKNQCHPQQNSGSCRAQALGYPCCSSNNCKVYYTDSDGQWGVENNNWCGISSSCSGGNQQQTQQPTRTTTTQQQQSAPTSINNSENFFDYKLYSNPSYQAEVQSSVNKLSGELAQKAARVKYVPTAIWLAWEGAPAEVPSHLRSAGSDTITFMMYLIPSRDCNSFASAGGASDINTYRGYVDKIYQAFQQYPNTRINVVVEPDTIGNMVTSQNNQNCRNAAVMHKECLAYAVNKFGSLNNVHVYLDVAHNRWLGGNEYKTAQVVKEILDKAPQGKIRGFSTNVSNFQPVYKEYAYHQALNSAMESVGIRGMKFIVDTSRNGVDITDAFAKTQTWCNFVGTGFGERPKGSPDKQRMPLLDAYMWLKPPAESDGSATGSRADPVCARSDSLPGAPDAGQWFHDYFVMLLKNANPQF